MFWVYILFSKKLNRYYVGYSADPYGRLVEHNSGISSFTARAADWELCYRKGYKTREEAHREELRIKGKKSRKYIEWLIKEG